MVFGICLLCIHMVMDTRRWLNLFGMCVPIVLSAQGKIFIVSTMFTLLGLHMVIYPRHHPNHDGRTVAANSNAMKWLWCRSGCHVILQWWAWGSCLPKFCVMVSTNPGLMYIIYHPTRSSYYLCNGQGQGMLQISW